MKDLLFVTASLIAVLAFVGTAAKGLRQIRRLQHAPRDIDNLEGVLVAARRVDCGGRLDAHLNQLVAELGERGSLFQTRLMIR